MKHVFIIGSKGIPAKYGGFETFVDKLVQNQQSREIKYHVACQSDEYSQFNYFDANCFNIKVPKIGPSKAIYYDLTSLGYCMNYIKENHIRNAIIYILACRIGPFINFYLKKCKKYNTILYINPDGHEWKRSKWNWLVRKYWKLSEFLMVKHAKLIICDSKNIEYYVKNNYKSLQPKTIYLSYGADVGNSKIKNTSLLTDWLFNNNLKKDNYYLVVGRFVPENNYELIIKEYIRSKTKKNLVFITNHMKDKYYNYLKRKTNFDRDIRIKFVGTIYNQELLIKIRQYAFGYIHGHQVGGTNPSLLESLASTKINLLLDVVFNREVGENVALYWTKKENSLSCLIDSVDKFDNNILKELSDSAKKRILIYYNWETIIKDYEALFLR